VAPEKAPPIPRGGGPAGACPAAYLRRVSAHAPVYPCGQSQRSPFGYALCVKDLAKWPKWGSFERPRFCIVDFTEHRAE